MRKLLKFTEDKLLLYFVGALLFFVPLYPKFPLWSVSDTYVAIRLEDILVTLLLFVFGLWVVASKKTATINKPYFRWFFVFWLIGFVSCISAILVTKNVIPHLTFLHYLRRVEYMSLAFLAYFAVQKKEDVRFLVKILIISTLGVITYGLGQKFFGWPVVSTMNAEFSKGLLLKLTWWARINSTFAGHYDLAAYMVLIFPFFLTTTILVKRWSIKLISLFIGMLCYYLIILTASRISFPGYLISGSLVLIGTKKKWWLIPFLSLSILGMVFAGDLGQRYAATFKINLAFLQGSVKVKPPPTSVGIALPTPTLILVSGNQGSGGSIVIPTATPTPTEIPVATESGEFVDYSQEGTAMATARSTDIRLKVEWPRALRAFAKNPLLGTGYSSLGLATDNDYLRILGEVGLLGALVFYGLIAEIFLLMVNYWKKSDDKVTKAIVLAIISSSVGYFINAGFIDVWEASKLAFFFWLMIGVGLKITQLKENETN